MKNHYAKVKKGLLVDCLTCPLCSNLLREATTICVCLHTFCKECIYQKFEDDETNFCPICYVYLGCFPREKLRPDNNLQELRMKIFPVKKPKEPESTSIPVISTRRKEKLLSSLVTDTNPILEKPVLGRAKAVPKKAGTSRGPVSKSQVGKEVAKANDHLDWSYSPKRSKKLSMASKKQRISGEGPSQVSSTATDSSNHIEASDQKTDKSPSWEPLAFLTEAADRTNDSNKLSLGIPAFQMENNENTNTKIVKKFKRRARKSIHESIAYDRCKEVQNFHHSNTKDKILIPNSNGALNIVDSEKQSVATASESGFPDKSHKRLYPVWFSLLASKDQSEETFPQIPRSYIRIKDGSIPVSYIKRYLVQKLSLRDESEVEVMCCGQTLVPSTTLNNLMDIWAQNAVKTNGQTPLHLKEDCINSNKHSFVMVLTYKRSK